MIGSFIEIGHFFAKQSQFRCHPVFEPCDLINEIFTQSLIILGVCIHKMLYNTNEIVCILIYQWKNYFLSVTNGIASNPYVNEPGFTHAYFLLNPTTNSQKIGFEIKKYACMKPG